MIHSPLTTLKPTFNHIKRPAFFASICISSRFSKRASGGHLTTHVWSVSVRFPGSCAVNSGTQTRSRRVTTQASCGGTCTQSKTGSQRCTPIPVTCQVSKSCLPRSRELSHLVKTSFPLIAKANSQARSSAYKYCDWMKVLAASLRASFCDHRKRAIRLFSITAAKFINR